MTVANKINLIFLILQLFNFANSSKIGEACSLGNNQNGVCKEMKNCGYAKKLFAEQRISEIKQCDFNGEVPVVCCSNTISPEATSSNCKADKVFDDSNSKRHANVGEFPFFAAIGYKEEKKPIVYRCAGALISDDLVLVPAHCVCRRDNMPVTVKLGKTSINNDPKDNSEGVDAAVQSIILHPDYVRKARQNDIALIKLNRTAAPTSKYIKPICLSVNDENVPKNFVITGLIDLDANNRRMISNWLLKEPVHEYSFKKCKETLNNYGKEIVESQFCGSNPNGTNTCQAGPVSYHTSDGNVFLYGLGSYGGRCGSDFPDVYTKVNQYIDWIYAGALQLHRGF